MIRLPSCQNKFGNLILQNEKIPSLSLSFSPSHMRKSSILASKLKIFIMCSYCSLAKGLALEVKVTGFPIYVTVGVCSRKNPHVYGFLALHLNVVKSNSRKGPQITFKNIEICMLLCDVQSLPMWKKEGFPSLWVQIPQNQWVFLFAVKFAHLVSVDLSLTFHCRSSDS